MQYGFSSAFAKCLVKTSAAFLKRTTSFYEQHKENIEQNDTLSEVIFFSNDNYKHFNLYGNDVCFCIDEVVHDENNVVNGIGVSVNFTIDDVNFHLYLTNNDTVETIKNKLMRVISYEIQKAQVFINDAKLFMSEFEN
jgi:hypothetical protein